MLETLFRYLVEYLFTSLFISNSEGDFFLIEQIEKNKQINKLEREKCLFDETIMITLINT